MYPNVPPAVPPVIPPLPPPWKKKFPSVIAGILSFLQLGITVVIIGCEVGSILIDMVTATIYVGLWAGLFFVAAGISLASSSCCCRSSGCATYTLVIQCISLFFAACVIGFDTYFLINRTNCFFPSSTCQSSAPIRGVFYTKENFDNIKIPLIIAQLAAGGVMLFLCLIYIVIYIVTTIRVQKAKSLATVSPQPPYALPAVSTGYDGMINAPPVSNIRATRAASPLYHRPTLALDNGDGRTNDLLCPTCSTMMSVSVRKRPPQ